MAIRIGVRWTSRHEFTGLLFFGVLVLIGAYPLCAEEITSFTENSDVHRGAALVEARACRACHIIGGEGALVGPALDQVTLRRSKDWLKNWLREPTAMKPGTLMPEFDWSEDEFQAIFVYLKQFKIPVDGLSILEREENLSRAGEALIEAYQCWSCHRVTDESGRPIYPDLTNVKERRTSEWVKRWLKNPQTIKPGTYMPTFHLTDAEINALVGYLFQ